MRLHASRPRCPRTYLDQLRQGEHACGAPPALESQVYSATEVDLPHIPYSRHGDLDVAAVWRPLNEGCIPLDSVPVGCPTGQRDHATWRGIRLKLYAIQVWRQAPNVRLHAWMQPALLVCVSMHLAGSHLQHHRLKVLVRTRCRQPVVPSHPAPRCTALPCRSSLHAATASAHGNRLPKSRRQQH